MFVLAVVGELFYKYGYPMIFQHYIDTPSYKLTFDTSRKITDSEFENLAEKLTYQARLKKAKAVTADEIAQFDVSELTRLLQNTSRGRFGSGKAQAIQHAALHSVGIGFLTDAVRIEMRCLLEQIDLLDAQVAQIEDASATLMEQIPQHITSIPGVGLVTGAAILAEIGDIHRFAANGALIRKVVRENALAEYCQLPT